MATFIAGIDYSMSSPGITIYDQSKPFKYENCLMFGYVNNKKLNQVYDKRIIITQQTEYGINQERFDYISDWAMTILNKFNVKFAIMEGYSYGSKGSVFEIAENGGLIKHKMWKSGIEFIIPSPSTVKKVFSGNGRANKIDMHDAFEKQNNVSISEIIGIAKDKSPVSDLVDSYAMVYYYLNSSK